jgi:hypothetical protein
VYRSVALLALIACAPPERAPDAVRHWVEAPGPVAWPLGSVTGRIGRAQAPQPVVREGVEAANPPRPVDPHVIHELPLPGTGPLLTPTAWAVPGTNRAVVYGLDVRGPSIDLIDVDKGLRLWRASDAAPVVGVTADAIVCSDAHGTRGVGMDGKPRWNHDATFVAMTDDRVIEAGGGEAVISEAATGDELARVKLPAGVTSDSIVASCGDAGRELFAATQDGTLGHVVEAHGGPTLAWSVAVGTVVGIEACEGETVLVTASTEAGTTLYALARATGAIMGRIDDVRGYWPARDGSDRLEVSTNAGVFAHGRTLADATPVALPVLGELLAKKGDRRLVRATPSTAALLDKTGVRAYVPLAELGAVLGDEDILAASWLGSAAQTARRFRIPPPYRRTLRIAPRPEPVAVPAELRDLPPIGALPAGVSKVAPGVPASVTRALGVEQPRDALALAGDEVYVATAAGEPDAAQAIELARFDLRAQSLAWMHPEGCGRGVALALAVARDMVACASRGPNAPFALVSGSERRGGSIDWEWRGAAVDGLAAAGDVVAVLEGDRAHLLAARDGHVLGELVSDDGGLPRVAVLDVAGMTMVVSAERGRVVARLADVQLAPAWSLEVAGVVKAITVSADGVLVELEDGDAYRVDARTGVPTALPGLGLVWRAPGDLVTGEAAGGPIPPATMPEPPKPKQPPAKTRKAPSPPKDADEHPPPIATPWPPPPPMADSWQYTLYELSGGLRARNDYALAPPVAPATARGPGQSPLVVAYGPGLRELIVIDPRRGDPLRRVRLPDEASPAFSTMIDGKPVAGVVLAKPLRLVLF